MSIYQHKNPNIKKMFVYYIFCIFKCCIHVHVYSYSVYMMYIIYMYMYVYNIWPITHKGRGGEKLMYTCSYSVYMMYIIYMIVHVRV